MVLGRGLNSLIPTSSGKIREERAMEIAKEIGRGEEVIDIPLEKIEPNPYQPRKEFSHLSQEELINSIKEYGIIEPLILTKGEQDKYQIIAGERRFRAAQFLGMKTVPGIVRQASEIEKLEISLLENVQRRDLNPIEKAKAYQRLIDEFNLTEEEIAKKMGKARSTISNTLRLLSLPLAVQGAIGEEKISEGHAKALMSLEDKDKQEMLLRRILGLGLTVRETEKMSKGKRVYKKIELDPEILEKEKKLADSLGVKVKIEKTREKRKIIIEVMDDEELNRLIEKLLL
ncbi:chromosome partitioning protein ParB [bacterium (Candidatus Moisslbacteria) CG_4_9_14_0_8_um_filter_36_20]|nr:MAG: chromosome partitioning protein ParB [bacterium (Candidatus Moisslbacteria) CG_4_9_14_0_8_um_filter_36_20]